MSQASQRKASIGDRLPGRIAVGALTVTFPPAPVDEVLEAAARVERCHLLLSARVVVHFTRAMRLRADEGHEGRLPGGSSVAWRGLARGKGHGWYRRREP